MKPFYYLLIAMILFGIFKAEAQTFEQYAQQWINQERARFATYHYEGSAEFSKRGYVSDRPYEWSKNLGLPGDNVPVDPFFTTANGDTIAKHVVIFVHGYGGPLGSGRYYDRFEPFLTSIDDKPHETGATAWFDPGQAPGGNGPKLYPYLRFGNSDVGFDPDEWVILAVSLNILPEFGAGRSILENADRLRALMDALWHEYHPWIKTLSFVSHSTGSPVVKSVLGERGQAYRNQHPWIAYVDDHINLAGALGGTPAVLLDAVAMLGPLGQQLLYGIQHPDDHISLVNRYSAEQTVLPPFRKKRTYRWPEHINVLSVAGVWNGGPLLGMPIVPVANFNVTADGNPFSGGAIYNYPSAYLIDPAGQLGITAYLGKFDGVVSNMGVLERIDYRLNAIPLHLFSFTSQTEPNTHYEIDWDSNWVLPSLSNVDGGGQAIGQSNAGNAAPSRDRNKGTALTYVEVEAEHNGMLHNQHLLRLIKRRLGDVTITPHIKTPMIQQLSQKEGVLAGGNKLIIDGDNFSFMRYVQFGNIKTDDFSVINSKRIEVIVPPATNAGPVKITIVNNAGKSIDNNNPDHIYTYKGLLEKPLVELLEDQPRKIQLKAENGTSIYYSFSNPLPGPGAVNTTLYTEPFIFPVNPFSENSEITLYARAFKEHHFPSETLTEPLLNTISAHTPEIEYTLPRNPDGTATVRMTSSTPVSAQGFAPVIFYTTNGSNPDINAQVYNGPITVGIGEHQFKARAFQYGFNISPVSELNFTIYDPADGVTDPEINPFSSQAFAGPITISMKNFTEGSTIRYNIGIGELPPDPTETGAGATTYTQPIIWNEPGTDIFIKARAFKAGQSPSKIVQTGKLTQNIPITQAGKPSIFGNFFKYDLRGSLPPDWEGQNGGGGDLFLQGTLASVVLDHEEDMILSDEIDFKNYEKIKLSIDIRRAGAGGGPLLLIEVSNNNGNSWNYLIMAGTIPGTAFETQTFTFDNPGSPVKFRLRRANVNGEVVSGLSALRLRDIRFDALLSESNIAHNIFHDPVEISMENFTPNPSNPQQNLASFIVFNDDGQAPEYTLPIQAPNKLYQGIFTINSAKRISAKGFYQQFLTDSDITSVYVRLLCKEPIITPLSQNPVDSVMIYLESPTTNAQIRYTLDGSIPNTESLLYENLFKLGAGNHNIKARSFKSDFEPSETSALNIEVKESLAPEWLFVPEPTSITEGQEIIIRGLASGNPEPQYQWYKSGSPIDGAVSATLRISRSVSKDSGLYRLRAYNSAGSIFSEEVFIKVSPLFFIPEIMVQPNSQTISAFNPLTLNVVARANPAPEYQWIKDGRPIAGANASELNIPLTQLSDSGIYQVRVSNRAGNTTSREVKVSVIDENTPKISNTPEDQEVFDGENVRFEADITQAGNVFFIWLFNGQVIPLVTTSFLDILNAGPENEGEYQVIVWSMAGADTSDVFMLKIKPPDPDNQPPVLEEIRLSMEKNSTLVVEVLSYASDPDGDELSIQSITQAKHGQITLLGTNEIQYIPNTGFTGEDDFEVTIRDGRGGTATGTVYISVSDAQLITKLNHDEHGTAFQIYPNPLQGQICNIKFYLTADSDISIDLFNLNGLQVLKIYKGWHTGGPHLIQWQSERSIPDGLYLLNIQTSNQTIVEKLLIKNQY
ncbi:MAG: immunoglobulin domain-containing protein [Cyclobacteriaceae bacterium]|nr:immunoglobulin domain-containing protein [Cyclobacteriaceae bacterium]